MNHRDKCFLAMHNWCICKDLENVHLSCICPRASELYHLKYDMWIGLKSSTRNKNFWIRTIQGLRNCTRVKPESILLVLFVCLLAFDSVILNGLDWKTKAALWKPRFTGSGGAVLGADLSLPDASYIASPFMDSVKFCALTLSLWLAFTKTDFLDPKLSLQTSLLVNSIWHLPQKRILTNLGVMARH